MGCFEFIVILIFAVYFLSVIYSAVQDIKSYVAHKNFINSVKIWDVFEFSPIDEDDNVNPFDEKINGERSYCTIIDIKESNYGIKYVQYVYGKNAEWANTKFSDTLESFLRHRKRIEVNKE